jgi:uncharacterized protein (UPF0335 family)
MDREILSHLIDIKERIASVEAKQDQVTSVIEKVAALEQEVTQIRTTIKVYQWIAGISVALIAAVVKVWKN